MTDLPRTPRVWTRAEMATELGLTRDRFTHWHRIWRHKPEFPPPFAVTGNGVELWTGHDAKLLMEQWHAHQAALAARRAALKSPRARARRPSMTAEDQARADRALKALLS